MNNIINEIFHNSMLYNPIFAWIIAQLTKTLFTKITTGKFLASRLVGPGGMPSSHAAMMSALTITIAKVEGVSTASFAISIVISFIVMYDAMGVRWHAGEHAKIINKLAEFIDVKNDPEQNEKLQEVLGHRPIEVIVGALIGIAIGIFMPN